MPLNEKELSYYKNNNIPENTLPKMPDQQLETRRIEIFFEPFNARPQDIFFFIYENQKFIGRKHISELSIQGRITGTKCSQIKAAMLLGIVKQERVLDKGILLAYLPIKPEEKLGIFNQLKFNVLIEIYFPYPFLNQDHKEDVSPIEFWNPSLSQVQNLNAGEDHIRKYTIHFLSRFNLKNKIIYDPACSTGQFLGTIKKYFPMTITIGQDLNPKMTAYARTHSNIDQIYEGDAKNSPIKDESVDFIFFRFLNLEVVSTEMAQQLFPTIANRCRNGGYLILLGHTPILLSAEIFKFLGLQLEQCIAHNSGEDAIFQYYVLKKLAPVPKLDLEKMSVFNVTSSKKKIYPATHSVLFRLNKTIQTTRTIANESEYENRAKL